MDIGSREWLIVGAIIFILLIVVDGWRRMRAQSNALKIDIDDKIAELGDDNYNPELPLGTARAYVPTDKDTNNRNNNSSDDKNSDVQKKTAQEPVADIANTATSDQGNSLEQASVDLPLYDVTATTQNQATVADSTYDALTSLGNADGYVDQARKNDIDSNNTALEEQDENSFASTDSTANVASSDLDDAVKASDFTSDELTTSELERVEIKRQEAPELEVSTADKEDQTSTLNSDHSHGSDSLDSFESDNARIREGLERSNRDFSVDSFEQLLAERETPLVQVDADPSPASHSDREAFRAQAAETELKEAQFDKAELEATETALEEAELKATEATVEETTEETIEDTGVRSSDASAESLSDAAKDHEIAALKARLKQLSEQSATHSLNNTLTGDDQQSPASTTTDSEFSQQVNTGTASNKQANNEKTVSEDEVNELTESDNSDRKNEERARIEKILESQEAKLDSDEASNTSPDPAKEENSTVIPDEQAVSFSENEESETRVVDDEVDLQDIDQAMNLEDLDRSMTDLDDADDESAKDTEYQRVSVDHSQESLTDDSLPSTESANDSVKELLDGQSFDNSETESTKIDAPKETDEQASLINDSVDALAGLSALSDNQIDQQVETQDDNSAEQEPVESVFDTDADPLMDDYVDDSSAQELMEQFNHDLEEDELSISSELDMPITEILKKQKLVNDSSSPADALVNNTTSDIEDRAQQSISEKESNSASTSERLSSSEDEDVAIEGLGFSAFDDDELISQFDEQATQEGTDNTDSDAMAMETQSSLFDEDEQDEQDEQFSETPDNQVLQSSAKSKEPVRKLRRPIANIDDPEVVLIITVVAKENYLDCAKLKQVVKACGMEFGDMDVFHRFEEGQDQGAVQFSMANAVNPGTFDLEEMETATTPGVSFFMSMDEPLDPRNALDCMLATAEAVAKHLNGDLLDDDRSVMRPQTKEHYRERIRIHEMNKLRRRSQ